MPSRAVNLEYCAYVIGEVESNWDWGGVYYVDPITIGLWQNYAYNAARLLRKCRDLDPNWATFAASAPRIAGYLDRLTDNQWESVYLSQEEGNAWVALAESEANHRIQTDDIMEVFNGYMDDFVENYGLSDDNPKQLIFACSMRHQGPRYCFQVLNNCGPYATLEYMYQTCLNNRVLGQYRSRYDKVYQRLNEWDGESMPPDYGQGGSDIYSGQGGQGSRTASISVSRIYVGQGNVMIYGTGYENGIQCFETTPGNWIPQRRNITGGANANPQYIGGGSGDAQAVCDLYDSWAQQGGFRYVFGSGGRLSLPESGESDCSGSIWCAYHLAAGVSPGETTAVMMTLGEEVCHGRRGEFGPDDMAQMLPGDLIIYAKYGDVSTGNNDHVEMYMGDGYQQNLLGGGSSPVPHYKDAEGYTNGPAFASWQVRRYL